MTHAACNILKWYSVFPTHECTLYCVLCMGMSCVQWPDLYREEWELWVVILRWESERLRQTVTGHEDIIRRPRPIDPRPEMIGDQSPPGPRSIRTQDWHPPTFQKWTEQWTCCGLNCSNDYYIRELLKYFEKVQFVPPIIISPFLSNS